ncbi:cyclopropane-fatty-acyl-phospholipid synthase family protein [Telmatospirillum sp.]|uniref:cyclopropane-fatty-acyl-phospholipid synthase family protein n=1 Tax=Telmatospirillum sp. TaxID=2079197 RepID=UPI002844E7EB|nr:cyclopropane-fatty-acyl-phospholipid synthase family protein [Telmatospirillum sp.]MDR3435696.1 cyclopropane-fatty-acyl-phospholipid synthase [Telmatospirillum sp.]
MLFLEPFLRRFVRYGLLTVIDSAGQPHRFCGETLPGITPSTIRLRDSRLAWSIPLSPSISVGEAYMDGRLIIEEGTLYNFLALATANARRFGDFLSPSDLLDRLARRFQQWNPVKASRRNVAHHYDLSDSLYDLFLDRDRLYSCAYFATPEVGLDEAQTAKKRHIINKLQISSGQRILDIGCGWGGLALSLAREANVRVTGITLSEHQLAIARQRAATAGLADRVNFELLDYRQIHDSFDRIVSVGMFEHVGIDQYSTFFHKVHDLLTDDGIALLHAIGRSGRPTSTDPWIRKYIFPGGYCPSLSEVFPAVEKSGLSATDLEILRPCHYADTLRHWRNRFCARWDKAAALYDERFCRLWEFYLAGAEAAFRHRDLMVFQMQMTKDPSAVPRTRNYMLDPDNRMEFAYVAE